MARNNFTVTAQGSYKLSGKSHPLPTLTSDPRILKMAGRLYRQGMKLAEAHQAGRECAYHPIQIPLNLQHIFGK